MWPIWKSLQNLWKTFCCCYIQLDKFGGEGMCRPFPARQRHPDCHEVKGLKSLDPLSDLVQWVLGSFWCTALPRVYAGSSWRIWNWSRNWYYLLVPKLVWTKSIRTPLGYYVSVHLMLPGCPSDCPDLEGVPQVHHTPQTKHTLTHWSTICTIIRCRTLTTDAKSWSDRSQNPQKQRET